MSQITDVEAMVNNFPKSKSYGVPFGVKLWYSDGSSTRRSFSDAMCAPLSKEQREFIEDMQQQSNEYYSNLNL